MKFLLILVSLLSLNDAFAQGLTDLKNGDTSLSQAHAQIIEVKKVCEPNEYGASCRAYGSSVKIKVTMIGCIDHLGGTFSNSEVTRCVQAPSEIVTVSVPFEGQIELVQMNFKGANLAEQ